jgi:hypothetical protein
MHLEKAVVAVSLAREQRVELRGGEFLDDRAKLGLALQGDALVVLGLGEFDQREGVVEFALDAQDRPDPLVEVVALAQGLLGARGVVPELGRFGESVKFGEAFLGVIPVKDASSAVPRTA